MSADPFLRDVDGGVCAARGVMASAVTAGIKESGRPDMTLLAFDPPAQSAGVFTQNKVCAAPVVLCRERVGKGPLRAILVNSGNANACTGKQGLQDARQITKSLASHLGCPAAQVAMCSTGIIGKRLPVDLMERALRGLVQSLAPGKGHEAAVAIMTTDTRPKESAVEVDLPGGRSVRLGGMTKGAGMIAPNMATMLAFLSTDAAVSPRVLAPALRKAAGLTFNCVTVDGDTSTNDTAILAATGASGVRISGGEALDRFRAGLERVCRQLALAILRDGEGITKVVEIRIRGAASPADATRAGRTVAESLLVKTAFFGGLPNWGRIFAAAGRSGARISPDRMSLQIGGVPVVRAGAPVEGWEEPLAPVLKRPEFTVELHLGAGRAEAAVWTTDLSYEYVKINADYRT